MNTYLKILSTLIFTLSAWVLQAQNFDSLTVVNSSYDALLRSEEGLMHTLFYKHKNDVLLNSTGTYGSAHYYPSVNGIYNRSLFETENVFNENYFTLEGVKPFTNITYVNASRKEQLFKIKHIQKFGKLLFFNFDLNKISSPGAYINQEANNSDFNGTLKFNSKKDNYHIIFSTEIKRLFYEENGGLLNIADFENSIYDNERTYNVNLNSSNSYFKSYTYNLEQRLDLFKVNALPVYLKHKTTYTTNKRVFYDNDPLSSIYRNNYIDTLVTIDSISNSELTNMAFVGFRSKDFSFELFGQYDYIDYAQTFGIDTIYHNTYAGFGSSYNKNDIKADLIAKYGVYGYRQNDVEAELIVVANKEKYKLEFGTNYFLTEPNLNFVNYTSNHFDWKNYSLEKQSLLGFNVDFELKKWELEFSVETKLLTNTLYFDSLAEARQDKNNNAITNFSLAKNYKLLNFHFRTAVIYQLTSDKYTYPLPDVIARQVAYYEKYIFKRALKIQFGVGASYTTDYYGYAYMPALTQFYTQNHTQLGYYPNIDVFLNTHLKRAQIFLKYEHINAGRSLEKSYAVPRFPSLNKSLKFGVSWNLFD
jgi:hypothetical protein